MCGRIGARWLVGLLVIAMGSWCIAGDPHFDAAQKLFEEGMSLMDVRKYAEARAKFERSIKEYEQVAATDRNKKSAGNNIKAAQNNIVYAYEHDAFYQLKDGDKLYEQKKYDQAAASYAASVKAYALAEKMTKRDYQRALNYAKGRAVSSKGLEAIAAKAPAPEFALSDLEGKTVQLSDYKGKVVLLDFWAVWCHPCRELVPALDRLYQKHNGRGFVVLGLNMDKVGGYDRGRARDVDQFAKENIHYPVLWATDEVRYAYGDIPSVPTVIMIDKDGRFFHRYAYKETTEENLEKDLLKLLGK